MRKYLIVLFMSAITIPASAQKGSTLLYGNLTYQYMENLPYGGGNGSNFSFSPAIGYGFSNRWTAGLNLRLGFINVSYESTTYGAGPFIRYTYPLSEIFSVFGQFETLYAIENIKGGNENRLLSATLFPAVEMNIRNGFAFNFGFGGINFTRTTIDGFPGSVHSSNIQFGSGINFGVSKRFGSKK